ncbi:MAG: hypothetical protein E7090_08310 [Bacteroidales bacterium]|nr:hypothetical protein [Bacteroidales bacterium]
MYLNLLYKKQTAFLLCSLFVLSISAQDNSIKKLNNVVHSFMGKRFDTEVSQLETTKITCASDIFTKGSKKDDWIDFFYIYEVSDKNNKHGFAIILNDTIHPKILGYSDNSRFNIENIPSNVEFWLKSYINNKSDNKEKIKIDLAKKEVEPLLGNTMWGQSEPFNSKCPTYIKQNCLTGCVATGMAQVMYYHKYPRCGNGYISYSTSSLGINVTRNLNNYPIEWELMLDNYTNDYSQKNADAVADLMFSCGASVNMDYATGASGAKQYMLLGAYINNFKYDKDAFFAIRDFCDDENWHNLLLNELNENRPVNYGGTSSVDGGHSFVIDGYKILDNENFPYYHINWGWEGFCDGYYLLSDMCPVSNGISYSESGFTGVHQMLLGVKPEDNIDQNRNIFFANEYNVSSTLVPSGCNVKISIPEIYNMSLNTFNGEIKAYLISDNNEEIFIGSVNIEKLEYIYGVNKLSISANIPNGIADATYLVELRSKCYEFENEQKVYSSSYPQITIENSLGEISMPYELGTSELEIIPFSGNETDFILRAYEIINLTEETFTGSLNAFIISQDDNAVAILESSVFVETLNSYEISSKPFDFKITIPCNLKEGNYKLCLGLKNSENKILSFVNYYDIIKPEYYTREKAYISMEVQKDSVYVGGYSFVRNKDATDIEKIRYKDIELKHIKKGITIYNKGSFDVDIAIHNEYGVQVCSQLLCYGASTTLHLRPGVYVISYCGSSKKILIY